MTKHEFLSQLERRLRVLPENEQRDAVDYYEGYISDAGEENAEAIEQLGSPAEVASKIIAGYAAAEHTETDLPRKHGLSMAWAIILAVFAAPIALPLALAVACVALALLIAILSSIAAFGAAALGAVLAGFGSLIIGIIALYSNLALALMLLGTALIALGTGVMLAKLTVAITKSGFHGVARFVSKIITGRGSK